MPIGTVGRCQTVPYPGCLSGKFSRKNIQKSVWLHFWEC